MSEERYCQQVRRYLLDRSEDYVFGLSDLEGYGSYDAIRQELSRLVRANAIKRLFIGTYWVNYSGQAHPNAKDVVAAVVRNNHWIIFPGTELARYELGLSLEPPQELCYLSTGPSTSYNYCETQCIRFKHCGSKFLISASPRTSLVVSALMDTKTFPIGPKDITYLADSLNTEDKTLLIKERMYIPARLRPIIEIICR